MMSQSNEFSINLMRAGDGSWVISHSGYTVLPIAPFDQRVIEYVRREIETAAQEVLSAGTSRRHGAVRKGLSGSADAVLRKHGGELFGALFYQKIGQAFRERVQQMQRVGRDSGKRQTLRIRVCADRALAMYPFELMYCDGDVAHGHLGLDSGFTIVRSILNESLEERPRPVELPLKILIVGASPSDQEPLAVDDEIHQIKRALNMPKLIMVDAVQGPDTMRSLRNKLRSDFHVLHFIGHGEVDEDEKEGKEGFLFFEGHDRTSHRVSATTLMGTIGMGSSLRLVTLNSCMGTVGDPTRPASAVALSILQKKVSAVVAMQYAVTDYTAVAFARCFYTELALGNGVDGAIAVARCELRSLTAPPSPEWATPILYLNTEDGDIFGLREKIPPEELVSYALEQFRLGNWGAAKQTAAFAREQGAAADSGVSVDDIQRVADQCDQLTLALLDLQAILRSADMHVQEALRELQRAVEAAEELDVGVARAIGGTSSHAVDEATQTVEALRAYHRGELDESIHLCGTLPRGDGRVDRVDFGLLDKFLTAERDVLQVLHRFEICWRESPWAETEGVIARAMDAVGRRHPTLEGLRGRRALLRRLIELESRVESDDSFDAAELAQIHRELQDLSLGEGPRDAVAFRELVTLALRGLEALASRRVDLCQAFVDEASRFKDAQVYPRLPAARKLDQLVHAGRCLVLQRKAVEAYQAGRFTSALQHFEELEAQGYGAGDPAGKVALCRLWLGALAAMRNQDWPEALRVLIRLRTEVPRHRDLTHPPTDAWVRWCRRAPSVLGALHRMSGLPLIAEPSVPWEGGDSPYPRFAEFGISPTSTIEDCDKLGYAVQGRGEGMGQDARRSWDALRLVTQRLLVDFGVYEAADAGCAQRLYERLLAVEEGSEPGMSPPAVAAALGADYCIFRALEGQPEGAMRCFLERAERRPYDARSLHHVGLAAAAAVRALEKAEDEQRLEEAWEQLIIGWGPVFGDERRFWHPWWARCRRYYGVPLSSDNIHGARQQLQRFWLDRLKASGELYPGMDVTFQAEIHGVRAVAAGGGIPLPGEPAQSAVVGLCGARALKLLDAVAKWVGTFEPQRIRIVNWQQRVCRYFSVLAEPTALFEEGRFEEVIERLSDKCFDEPIDRNANPGFAGMKDGAKLLEYNRLQLLEQSHFKLALRAGSESEVDVETTARHWASALAFAGRRSVEAESQLRDEIRRFAVGRARFLTYDTRSERRTAAIENAVRLLQAIYDRGWDGDDHAIRTELSETLLTLAVHLSNEFDDERSARSRALAAYSLTPRSLRAIETLCQASLHYARALGRSGRPEEATALLKEIEEQHLPQGEQLFPGSPGLDRCRENLENIRKLIADGSPERLREVLDEFGSDGISEEDDVENRLLVSAMLQESQGNYAQAEGHYWDLVQRSPDNREMRERLAGCYRAWVLDLDRTGREPERVVRAILTRAKERCAGSTLLDDMMENVDASREEAGDGAA